MRWCHRLSKTMTISVWLLLVLVAYPNAAVALGTNEQASLTKWITSAINAELQGPSSTEHVYYGVKALAALGTDPTKTITKAPLCTAVDTAPHGTIQQALYAASLAATFSCNANALYKDAEALAHAALADPTSVDDTHAAVALLAALKGAGVKVKAPSLTALPGLYKELTHSTGLLRPAKDVKLPTFAATGYAYATVAMAKSVFGGIAAGDLEKNIAQVLAAAKPDGGLWAKADGDHLRSTALVLSGAAALKAPGVDAAKVGAAAGFLSRFTDVGSLPDAYWLLTGLQSLQGTSLPQGLLLEAGKTSGGPPGEVVVRVVLHPAYGSGGVPDCTVSGSAVMGKDVSVPLDFKGGHNDNTYRAGFTPTVLGEYSIQVSAKDCSDGVAGVRASLTYSIEVADTATLVDVSVSAASGSPTPLTYPAKLSSALVLTHTGSVKVSFKVQAGGKAITPEQAFVVLTHGGNGQAALFPAKAGKAGALEASITSAGVNRQLGTLGGDYTLSLLVGDSSIAEDVQYTMGTVTVSHKPREDGSQPPPPAGLAIDVVSQPKKQILHMHRQPDKRPPAVVSLTFSALALLPAVIAVGLLSAIGANIKGFTGSIPQLLFHGGIASILLLLYLFWTRINLLQTLPLLAGLGLFTSVAGYFALSAHAQVRLKSD